MRLNAVRIDSLPGLAGPLEVERLQPGVNVIVGRNASGKSSLVRALAAVLYPDRHAGQAAVRLELEDASGRRITANRLGAQVEWQGGGRVAERPNLPPVDLLAAYLLRLEDLIALQPSAGSADAGALNEHMSQRLRLELTGGVDLRALRDGIPKPKTAGQKEATALRRAESALAKLRRERDALLQRQERLAEDREARTVAEAAAERLRWVGEARDLVADLEALSRCQAELAALPPQLERLTGEEPEDLSRLRQKLDVCAREEERLLEALAAAERDASAAALPESLTAGEAVRVVDRAKELCRLEQKLEQAEVEVQAATAAREAAWRRMGGVPAPADTAIGPEVVDRVERLVHQQLVVRARLSTIRRGLAALGDHGTSPSASEEHRADGGAGPLGHRLEALRRCRADLARWWEARSSVGRLGKGALAVALALAGAGTVLALAAPSAAAGSLFAEPWPAAVASGAAALWLLLCLVSSLRSGSAVARAALSDLQRSAAAADVSVPSHLTTVSAARLLDETSAQVAQLERELAREEERSRELAELRVNLSEATREAQRTAAELGRLRTVHGFAPTSAVGEDGEPAEAEGSPDAGFAYWLSAALEHGRACSRLAAAQATVRDLEDRVSDVRSEVIGFLGRSAPTVSDWAAAGGTDVLTACEQVSSAIARRDAAAREATDLRRALERAVADRREAERSLSALARRLAHPEDESAQPEVWSPAALDDLALTARRLVDALPGWRQARTEEAELRTRVDYRRQRLTEDLELLAAAEARDLAAIEELAALASAADAEVQRLTEKINRVEAEVQLAEGKRALEEASADAQRARDDLEAHLDEALEASAARTLLDVVEEEHESAVRPAALERARSWFSRFTHDDFELVFEQDADGEWRFGAVDKRAGAGGSRLAASELSTGTRAQLLLAARLAFALDAERSYSTEAMPVEPLPFFLDEALTTSDPERFSQVANAIFDVSQETGRQFIYLSARDEDAELWRDVAAERGANVTAVSLQGPVAPSTAS